MKLFQSLVVELTSECNRACKWCMRQGDLAGRRFTDDGEPVRGKMPTAQAKRILREAADLGFRDQTTFYLMSEPFLDDRIIEMAQFAKALSLVPYVNTNGDVLMRNRAMAEAAGRVFSWVEITLYDGDPKIAAEKTAQLREWVGPRARFKGLGAMGPRPHVPRPGVAQVEAPCPRPPQKLVIQWDGSSPLCCYDINCEFDLPNAFDVTVKQLWHHPNRVRAAEALSKAGGRRSFTLCSTCPMPEVGYPPPFKSP